MTSIALHVKSNIFVQYRFPLPCDVYKIVIHERVLIIASYTNTEFLSSFLQLVLHVLIQAEYTYKLDVQISPCSLSHKYLWILGYRKNPPCWKIPWLKNTFDKKGCMKYTLRNKTLIVTPLKMGKPSV